MLVQIVIGSLVISGSVAVHACFVGAAEHVLSRLRHWFLVPPHRPKAIVSLVAIVLWLMAAHSIGVWLWAAAFIWVGVFDALEPALYFSVVSFTTLGFGDVLLGPDWRILAGICAANGLLIFGVSTAVLVEFLIRVRRAQTTGNPE